MEFFSDSLGSLPYFLLATSFIKLVVALSILRFGIGLDGIGFSFAVLLLAVALALFQVGDISHGVALSTPEGRTAYEEQTVPFLRIHTDEKVRVLFEDLYRKMHPQLQVERSDTAEKLPFSVSLASFVVSELQEALYIGLLFLIPFLLIDLFVANGLTLLGIENLQTIVVSLPMKLVFFLLIDGWALVSQRLLVSYVGG
ncbi:MAG: hypothetical protein KDD64_04185 [Bdellovibrionales bacterium]|nr:hypothetical protein [Bdellovibrionales bacterium]